MVGRCLFLLLALIPALTWAQEPVRSDATGPQQIVAHFDHLTIEDGLSHSRVWSVCHGSRGYLWIGTANGLNRYDGYTFKLYENDPTHPDSLAHNEVMAIEEDREGRLWIATRGGGLDYFDRDRQHFVHFRHRPDDPRSLSHDLAWSLLIDSRGNLWVGTARGLNRFDPDDEGFDPFFTDSINVVWEDRRRGDLWLGTDHGLLRFDPRTESFQRYRHDPADARSLVHNQVRDVRDGPSDTLWIATFGGLDRFDVHTETFHHYRHDPADPQSLTDDEITTLEVDLMGDLWIGTARGLHRWVRDTASFLRFVHDPSDSASLPNSRVIDLRADRQGLLWVASNSGLSQYDRRREQFTVLRRWPGFEPSLADALVYSLLEDRSGVVWVGVLDGGLHRIDRARHTWVHYRSDSQRPGTLPHDSVSAILEDRSGQLWVGTVGGGLARLDRDTGRFMGYRYDPEDSEGLASDFISSLYEDDAGRLWIATPSGISYLDAERRAFVDASRRLGSPEHTWFKTVLQDRSGDLWFGTHTQGVRRLEAESSWQVTEYHYDPQDPESLPSDSIATMFESSSGTLWVGTNGGGIAGLDLERRRFTRYLDGDGLAGQLVLGILEDDSENLWISTDRGLNRFDPRARTFEIYDVGDGLAGNQFIARSAWAGHGGELLFGGSGGVTAFFPDHIERDPLVPPVVFTEVLVGDESSMQHLENVSGPVVLPYQLRNFSFEFSALHLARPSKNRYAYRLEGFDTDWIETDASKRFAQYTNLDPGEYVFHVKGSNHHGVWNEAGATLAIVLEPPVWETWWAYSFFALAFVALITGVAEWHKRKVARERRINDRLREVDRLKDEFLARTSHELRTPLYGITGLVESLVDGDAGELPEGVMRQLETAVASGRRLAGLVDDILDFSKLSHHRMELQRQPVDLHALCEAVLTLSRPLVRSGVELINAVDPNLGAVEADEERLRQILHNLVGNAVKFTEEGTVEVGASVENGKAVVRVSDTGMGIAAQDQQRIFEGFERTTGGEAFPGTGLGLAITRQLVELHGGRLWLDSIPGQGTTFYFDLPLSTEAVSLAKPDSGATPVSATAEPETPVVAEDAPRVLVVDDEPVNRQVLAGHLAAGGYQAVQAADGVEALELLAQENVDLVLLDVMMPGMSGEEVCREIRQRFSRRQLPVIFLTAKSQLSDRLSGFATGANDYLTKPIAKNELLARVGVHLELLFLYRELESRVDERTAQLRRALGEVEAKNAELESFTYTVSHDLKSPLMTIMGFVGLLKRDVEAGRVDRLVSNAQHIEEGAKKMDRLLKELLELSRIGRMVNPPEEVPFADVVKEATGLLEGQIAQRGAELVVASDLPRVVGDRVRMVQLVQNLVGNGVKFMGDQEKPRVEVGVLDDDERTFFVRDNGKGIDPKFHDKIFGLFERLDPKVEGTGVGLALVKRIVEVHGGRIWVESGGEGSTFYFTLPDVRGAK